MTEVQTAVLIPVFNDRGGHLQRSLDSLVAQDERFHLIVVDDGSSPPLALDPAAYPFPVTLLRQPQNGGIERALNVGLEQIERMGFRYVARLDVGDTCLPGRLRRQREALDRDPSLALVGSQVEWVHDDGTLAFRPDLPTHPDDIDRRMHDLVCLIHPSVMFRTAVVAEVGPYSTSYPAAEDYEFFWRIARRHRVANLSEVLLRTRFDPAGLSISRRRRQQRSKLRIQLRYFRPLRARAWIGLARTVALMAIPYRLIVWLKSRRNGGRPMRESNA